MGETIEDAYRNAEDAKHEWLAAAIEDDIAVPEPDSIEDYSFGGNSRETMIMKLDYGVSDYCVVEVVGGAAYVMNYKTTDEGWRWVIQTII